MNLIIAVAVFICALCVFEGLGLLLKSKWDPEARRVKKQLQNLSAEQGEMQPGAIVRNRPLSSVAWLNRMLSSMPLILKLDNLLLQADARHPLGVFILASLVLGVCGFYATSLLMRNPTLATAVAGGMATVPFLYATMKRGRRMKKFEAQLPEALELMARSLRAGHALVGGLQMVAQEFNDPIGPEVQKTVTQINFGVSIEQALRNLTERVNCQDLKFLAVSIMIQRESGGNLAEILENIGSLIRARFTLRGKIRALSAEGKLSGIILAGIPFALAGFLFITTPDYVTFLVQDPAGRTLVFVALGMMAFGVAVMKKMISLKV
jgi:tight adherence protein B